MRYVAWSVGCVLKLLGLSEEALASIQLMQKVLPQQLSWHCGRSWEDGAWEVQKEAHRMRRSHLLTQQILHRGLGAVVGEQVNDTGSSRAWS